MHPLYSQSEFDQSLSRDPLSLKCKFCHCTFYQPKHEIQKVIAGTKQKTFDFCSMRCFWSHQDTRRTVICATCQSPVVKSQKEILGSKSGNLFCSRSCSAKWTNTHKTHGTRVSKIEVWFSKRLPELYPDLMFHFNRTDAINGELDIYIPSLKLAFELNGIFHYEPIFGPDRLSKTQTNDCRKFQACLERNIELCTIDISSIKHFKEHIAQKFLDIIISVINEKERWVG